MGPPGEPLGGEHPQHPVPGLGAPHCAEARVRELAADEGEVREAGRVQVVEVARAAAQQAGVLAPGEGAADGDAHASRSPSQSAIRGLVL